MKMVQIVTVGGPVMVRCYYTSPSGYLAVTRTMTYGEDGKPKESDVYWAITHLPTGRVIADLLYRPIGDVRKMVRDMDDPLWGTVVSNKTPVELKDKARRALEIV